MGIVSTISRMLGQGKESLSSGSLVESRLELQKKAYEVRKLASPGERLIGGLVPSRYWGAFPGGWTAGAKWETVQHFRHWTFVAIDAICCQIAMMLPNMARVNSKPRSVRKFGRTWDQDFGGNGHVDLGHVSSNRGFGSSLSLPNPSDGVPSSASSWGYSAHSYLTNGYYRHKAMSVVKPHEELEPLEADHPLRRLIENPNPVDTSFDLLYELSMFEELCGESYLWAIPNAFGVPCELWCIPSHWCWPRGGGHQYVDAHNPHADELIQYYEVRPWGGAGSAGFLRLPPNEVIRTVWKNPTNKIAGWSKLLATANWIDIEESISRSRWSQFMNQARPEFHVEMGADYTDMDEDRLERIATRFANRYQGELNTGKPIFTPPGSKVTPLSFSPAEMHYIQCLDEETECLTANGWKKQNELTEDTRIACYDAGIGKLVYRKPTGIFRERYKGTMYRWRGTRVDAMMTPGHRAYVNRPTSRSVGGKLSKKRTPYRDGFRMSHCRIGRKVVAEKVWCVRKVEELAEVSTYGILSAAPAACDEPTAVGVEKFGGHWQRDDFGFNSIDPKVWLRFLGYYLSEGCLQCREARGGVNGWEVVIVQHPCSSKFHDPNVGKKRYASIKKGIEATPFAWRRKEKDGCCTRWRVSDRGLYFHLLRHCGKGSFSKKVPEYVKTWPAEYLRVLLDALIEGDGLVPRYTLGRGGKNRKAGWNSQYSSRSRQLADDVMEIAVKCGLTASISVKKDRRKKYLGRELYVVNISSRTKLDVTANLRGTVEYDGLVWCVTVPTGLFVVRRNGKAHITGNSEEQVRDQILSTFRVPPAVVGVVKEMTYGGILSSLMSFCTFCVNPRLRMRGLSWTKFLAPKFPQSDDERIRIWWDDASPADPTQVNQDISQDLACILPGQELQGRVIGASKVRYVGEALEIQTASGMKLSVTPNHPVVTMKGFVPAGNLEKGQSLLHYVGKHESIDATSNSATGHAETVTFSPTFEQFSFADDLSSYHGDDEQYAPSLVEEVFEAASLVLAGPSAKPACSPLDFHGDAKGFKGKVQVVGSYSQLRRDIVADTMESLYEGEFVGRSFLKGPLAGSSDFHSRFQRLLAPGVGFSRGGNLRFPLFRRHVLPGSFRGFGQPVADSGSLHHQTCCFGGVSELDACSPEFLVEPVATDSKFIGKFGDGFSRCITSGKKLHVRQRLPQESLCFGSASELDVPGKQADFDDPSSGSMLAGDLVHVFAGKIVLDEIVEIKRFHYDGPVYDFESPLGYVVVESLLVSNCGAATPNEVRALRGRKPYPYGGDDPILPQGFAPVPWGTGRDLSGLADLIPVIGGSGQSGVGQEPQEELVDGGANGQTKPDMAPGIDEPNGEPTKELVGLARKFLSWNGNGHVHTLERVTK